MTSTHYMDLPEYAALVAAGGTDDGIRRLLICAHEAGHAIAYWHYGYPVARIDVTGMDEIGGYVLGGAPTDPTENAVITLAGMAGALMTGIGGLAARGIGGDLKTFDALALGDDWRPYADSALDIMKRHEPTLANLTARLLQHGDMNTAEAGEYSGLDWTEFPDSWPRSRYEEHNRS